MHAGGAESSLLRPLSRRVAGELQVLAVLAPVICSNVSAMPAKEVFATDASTSQGAVVSTPVSAALSRELWLSSDFRGRPVWLDSREVGTAPSSCRRPLSGAVDEDGCDAPEFADLGDEPEGSSFEHCAKDGKADLHAKPPSCHFDCVVFGPGSAFLVEDFKDRGLRPGAAIDFARSSEYDLASPHLRDWLVHLVTSRQVKSIVLWPALVQPGGAKNSKIASEPLR